MVSHPVLARILVGVYSSVNVLVVTCKGVI